MKVYLDNSATTKCFDSVAALMTRIMCEDYGNPASLHLKGIEAENHIKHAKEIIAANLKVNEKELYFTSGGTEADNLALVGTALANQRAGRHIITTSIEHPAILQATQYLSEQGFYVTYLPVDKSGRIRLEDLERSVTGETILVSVMHTNNEIGAIQPVAEAAALVKSINPSIAFHVDAVQGFGKFRIYPKRMGIDLLSVSGHKIHGPKGVGLLYCDERVKIKPLLYGGGQQKGLRPGTENVPGSAGLAKAVEEIYADLDGDVEKLYQLRDYFIWQLSGLDGVTVNGPLGRECAPHIVSVSIRGVRSEVMLHALEEKDIYVSAGSACSAKKHKQSNTLQAIGLDQDLMDSTLRFSFSVFTTMEEINYTIQAMYDMIPMLRKYARR